MRKKATTFEVDHITIVPGWREDHHWLGKLILWQAAMDLGIRAQKGREKMERDLSEALFTKNGEWRSHLHFLCALAGLDTEYVANKTQKLIGRPTLKMERLEQIRKNRQRDGRVPVRMKEQLGV